MIGKQLLQRMRWVMVAMMLATIASAETPVLSAPDVAQQVATGEMILLDIRRPREWAQTGVAQGAWPVSMHDRDFPDHLRAILAQHDPSDIALICATGGRTAYITDILEQNGIAGVADVSEGMFGNGTNAGWIARGLPVTSADQAIADYDAARAGWD